MARKIINVGSGPAAGDGECIRDAFVKINDNFDEVYALANQEDGHLTTDVTGSVFADDTSALVDGVAGKIVGPIDNEEITTTKIIGSDIPQISGLTPILEIETEVFTVCANGATYVADAVVPCPDATSLTLDNTDGTGGTVKLGNTGGGGILEIDNTGGGGILTLEGGNGGGSLVIDEGNSGNGGNVTIEGGGSGGGSLTIEGDNTGGSGNVIIEGGNSGGTLILEEGSSAGSGNVYLQSASCGSNGSIVIGGCNGVGGRVVLDSVLDTLTLGDATGINIDIDVSNRGITLGDTSSAGTSRINIDGDADRIRLGDFTGLSIDIDVNNDGINLGDLAGQFFTLDNANKTTTLGTSGGTQVEIDDTAKTVTLGDPTGTKITTGEDIVQVACEPGFPTQNVMEFTSGVVKIGDTSGTPTTPVLNLDTTTNTTTLGVPTGSKVTTSEDEVVVACKDFPYEMKLDGASGVVTVGDTSGTPTGPALKLDTNTDTTTLGKVDGTSPQVVLDGTTARIGTTNNYLTVDESTNVINIGGPSINISIDASNTVTFNGGANFNNITPEFNTVNVTQLTSNTDHSNNLTITANNYVIIDSENNGQIEIGRNSGVGNVIIGNNANGTQVQLEGDTIITGDLTVTGTTTTVNTTNTTITDNIITLNNGEAGSGVTDPGNTSGIEIDRGGLNNVSLLWNDSSDNWTLTKNGTAFYDIISGNDSIKALADVNSGMSPSDGQALIWDNGNLRWTSGTLTLPGLSDVYSSMSPNDRDLLMYDDANSRWTSANLNEVGINSSGYITVTETKPAGEGVDGIAWVQWTTGSELIIRIENTSIWEDKLDVITSGAEFTLVDDTGGTPIGTTVTVNGSVTKVTDGSYYNYTLPVDTAAGTNTYIGTFNLTRTSLSTVSQLSDLSDVDDSLSSSGNTVLWHNGAEWTHAYPQTVVQYTQLNAHYDVPDSGLRNVHRGVLRSNYNNSWEVSRIPDITVSPNGNLLLKDEWRSYSGSPAEGLYVGSWKRDLTLTIELEAISNYRDTWETILNSLKEGDTFEIYDSYSANDWVSLTITGPVTTGPGFYLSSNIEYTIPIDLDPPTAPSNDYSIYRFRTTRSFDTLRDGVISSNLYSDDSSILYDAGTHEFHGTLRGDVIGSVFADDSTKILDAETGLLFADLKGSVFANDSTMVIDGETAQVVGDVAYTPDNDTFWNDPKPTTVAEALNRMAEAIWVANGGSSF